MANTHTRTHILAREKRKGKNMRTLQAARKVGITCINREREEKSYVPI